MPEEIAKSVDRLTLILGIFTLLTFSMDLGKFIIDNTEKIKDYGFLVDLAIICFFVAIVGIGYVAIWLVWIYPKRNEPSREGSK